MGKVLYMRKGEQHTKPSQPLPSGYTKLAYIQSSGTQRLDTDFKPTGNTRIVFDFQMVNQSTTQQALFGSRPGTTGRFTVFTGTSTDALQAEYNTQSSLNKSGDTIAGLNTNNRNTIELSNSLTVNGVVVNTIDVVEFTSTYNLWLFANNNAGTTQLSSAMKLYACQIYDNGTLVRDFIPCVNESGAVGLYDVITRAFYGNAGTGVFIGSEVA